MLSGLEARAGAIADAAQQKAIAKGVASLTAAFPELSVSGTGGAIVLEGRIAPEDARLRWIGGLL